MKGKMAKGLGGGIYWIANVPVCRARDGLTFVKASFSLWRLATLSRPVALFDARRIKSSSAPTCGVVRFFLIICVICVICERLFAQNG